MISELQLIIQSASALFFLVLSLILWIVFAVEHPWNVKLPPGAGESEDTELKNTEPVKKSYISFGFSLVFSLIGGIIASVSFMQGEIDTASWIMSTCAVVLFCINLIGFMVLLRFITKK